MTKVIIQKRKVCMKALRLALAAALLASVPQTIAVGATAPKARTGAHARNVIIFVADGLRYDSVTEQAAPTLWHIRRDGVDFSNSHAIYPTLTTANASAIATGHYLGDTGDYANTLYTGYPVAAHLGATVTFLEDDAILRDVKQHFGAGYLGQTSLMQAARAAGMSEASRPAAISSRATSRNPPASFCASK